MLMQASHTDSNVSFLPSGSLARHLVWRLLPPILGLALLDLFLTWVVTHQLEVAGWALQDMFWLLLVGQLLLIASMAWVVVQGVRTGLRAVSHVAAEIALRSADDLSRVKVNSLPSELGPMLRHTNDLLDRLDDAMAGQRRFVGHAAHQLRTPLAGLKLESELMLAQALTPELRERAERIKLASDRMIRLGQQLLVLARVDPQTRPQDHFLKLDLCEWLRQSGAQWWHKARDANINLVMDAPPVATWVEGDPILLDELLSNLIDNALRYAKGATFVRLHISQTPPTLAVEDDGSGISPQEQGRVFEAFYRSPQAQSGGTGLGLAIVREIARAHGAWWNLVSRPQFSGTRLTVVFPGQRVGAQLNRLDQFNVVR
jgi:signal transduction histidine kinase